MSFDSSFARTVGIEGRYSNHKSDSGGETMYGITEKVARMFGYRGPMNELPLDFAKSIYKTGYWSRLRLDAVEAVAGEAISHELFDAAVNRGQGTAGQYLQRILNVMNGQGRLWPDIPVDGSVGSVTIGALTAYMQHRQNNGAVVLLRSLVCLRGADYLTLAEAREKDEDFVFGWILNRIAAL